MTEKLKLPDIGYSGGPLKVLAQLQVTISQGEYIVTISALILKDTPSPLLLAIGTDVRQSLYFPSHFRSQEKQVQTPIPQSNVIQKVLPKWKTQ